MRGAVLSGFTRARDGQAQEGQLDGKGDALSRTPVWPLSAKLMPMRSPSIKTALRVELGTVT